MKFPTIEDGEKRIVFEHTSGRFKGIHSICGLRKDAPTPLPEYNEAVDMHDHVGPVCLVASKPRYYLYREVFTPEMQNGKTFNEGQR